MSSETSNSGHKPPIPTPAKKIPALNIEKRGDRLYEINYLHKWFAISSLLLFVFTVAMVMADYSRSWKRYQREFNRLQVQRTQQDIQEASNALDRTRYNQLDNQLRQAQAEQEQNEKQIEEIQKKKDSLTARSFAVNQNAKTQKAIYDAEKYDYEAAVAAKRSNLDRLLLHLQETEKKLNDYRAEAERLSLELQQTNAELGKYVGKRDEAEKGIAALRAEYDRLVTRLNTLSPGLIVTSFRNAPVFDFMNPSERINQILLPNLLNEQPFKTVPKVDRCTTCHQGIDQKVYEKERQPFKAHPNLDLYLASNSPHPMEQFGCTTCHGGLDRSVDFQTAGHTPRNEEQKKDWEEKYGWKVEHFLETPMLAMNNIEAGCFKCHNAGNEVPRAASLGNGRDLIRIYGCFGCHKIPGYENVRKVGPDLSTVSGKLTKEWVRKWLANPKDFKSEARMPRFWYNSNNSGTINGVDFDKRNAAEINAIVEFLWSKSKPKALPEAQPNGNAAHGKELVETVGCFGCHAIGPIQDVPNVSQTRRRHGYNLASQGSKVTPSWLYNWVKDPRLVWSDTKMPMLRLTDAEAADVTAYVSSLKNADWEKKDLPTVDTAALDNVLLEFLRAGSTDIEARERLKTMSLEEKNFEAGRGLVRRYGCFGCHNIPEFENAQPIGTELTEAGSKLIAQLDFGFLAKELGGPLEHSRADWYAQKLKDPRIFDVGRVKRPEELLKMPNFTFNDRDVQSITMVLTSLVRDPVPLEMRDRTVQAIAEGRRLVAEKNCRGCHFIENAGRDIRGFLGITPEAQAQWPPNLNTEGFKTQPAWLHDFLQDPGRIKLRPWINARMPTFHFDEHELGILGRYFSALDKADYPYISTAIPAIPEQLRAGADLFMEAKCMSCHPTGSKLPPGRDPSDLAPDLMLAHERLRPDWIVKWLEDPQKIASGTKMPTFFSPDEHGVRQSQWGNILGGDVKAQIEAIRDHVFITVGGGRPAQGTVTSAAAKPR